MISQIIEQVNERLGACADYRGEVREQLQPLIGSVIRFLARCMDAQMGGDNGRMRYLYDEAASEDDLHQHIIDWLYGAGPYGYTFESQNVGGGRIDVMFTLDGFRFVVELKREDDDASRAGISHYLAQAAAYQATDVPLGMVICLDLTAEPLPAHIRDNVWVEVVPATPGNATDRYVCVVRVPGNRSAPSRLS